jgi:Cu(I)/Ag(I) efflux system periplasmic protein CusF
VKPIQFVSGLGLALALLTSAFANTEFSDGEVKKVDVESSKVTIKHGPIKNLDMPGMTMVFQVKDPVILKKLEVGSKIRFKAVGEGSKYIVTEVESAK